MKKFLYLISVLIIPLLGISGCSDVSDEEQAKEVINNYVMDLYNVEQDDKFFELDKKASSITYEKYAKELAEYLSSYKEYFTEKAFLTFTLNRAILAYRHENMSFTFKSIDYKDIKFDKEKNSITIDCTISFDAKALDKTITEELHDRRIIRLIKEKGKWKIISERVFYDQKLLNIKFVDQD